MIMSGILISGLFLVGSAAPASAQTTPIEGGTYDCNWGWVGLTSKATGKINHKEGVTVWNSWNNGSTYTVRQTKTTKHIVPSYKIYLTGVGGDISYGYVGCIG